MDNFEAQFNDNVGKIKQAYVDVHALYKKLDKVMSEYIKENKELEDSYKFLIMGRCINLLIYNFTLIKFSSTAPQETREGGENE